jgi:excinuclease UvrABC helicase subunit UvrB
VKVRFTEVSLVAILDADKEGFTRSHRSLTQTMVELRETSMEKQLCMPIKLQQACRNNR